MKYLEGDIGVLELLELMTICLQFVGDIFYYSWATREQQPRVALIILDEVISTANEEK